MNNLNARVRIDINSKLQQHTPEWEDSVRKQIQTWLQEMQRSYLEDDLEVAIKNIGVQRQLTLAGVTFYIM